MENNFKIYWNDAALLICDSFQNKQNSETVIEGDDACSNFLRILVTDTRLPQTDTVLLCSSPVGLMNELRKRIPVVAAGGGVVKNERNEMLMIYRKSRWDLPKGKSENAESIAGTALREVMEECGLTNVVITDFNPTVTFHFNFMKSNLCIKETYWFRMFAQSGQPLRPQAAEQISDIRWVSATELPTMLHATFPLIRSVAKWATR